MTPVVLVTGASRGIGAATALAFGRRGWRVAIGARTLAEGQALDHQLRYRDGHHLAGSLTTTAEALHAVGAEVFTQTMDLTDADSLDAALDATLAHYGRIDLLVNNAVYQDAETNALIADLDPAALARTLQGNVVAPYRLARRLLPTLVAQGGGRIINVCSGAGKHDPPVAADRGGWGYAYGASKAALARLAGVINREYGEHGVRAWSVNPGVVATEALRATIGTGGDIAKRYGAAEPETIAAALYWLATDPRAVALADDPQMIDLQPLVAEYQLI